MLVDTYILPYLESKTRKNKRGKHVRIIMVKYKRDYTHGFSWWCSGGGSREGRETAPHPEWGLFRGKRLK